MALVTISSIYQSISVGIFMMISCGWTLLHNRMSREFATTVTVSMGVTYLCYSAYYVSLPNSSFRIFMEFFMIILYSYIFSFVIKYNLRSLFVVERFCNFMESHNVDNILRATRLKQSMMRSFLIITIVFFSVQITFQGVIPSILEYYTKNLYFTTTLDLIQQVVDIVMFGYLLFVFRARNWPDYFLIASFELGNINQFIDGTVKEVEVYNAYIDQSVLASIYKQEYEDIINETLEKDSQDNLREMNIILLNPSYEEEYNHAPKDEKDATFYAHLTMAKQLKMSKFKTDEI